MIIKAEIYGDIAENLLAEIAKEESFQSQSSQEEDEDEHKTTITQARTDMLALRVEHIEINEYSGIREKTTGEFVTKSYELFNSILKKYYTSKNLTKSFESEKVHFRLKGECRDFIAAVRSLHSISEIDTSQRKCQGTVKKGTVEGSVIISGNSIIFSGALQAGKRSFSSSSEKEATLKNRLHALSDITVEIERKVSAEADITSPALTGYAKGSEVDHRYITRLLSLGFVPQREDDWLNMHRDEEKISLHWRSSTIDRISVHFGDIPSTEMLHDLRKYLTQITLEADMKNIEIPLEGYQPKKEEFRFVSEKDSFTAEYDMVERKLILRKSFDLSDLRGISRKMQKSMTAMEEYIQKCREM